MDTTKFHNILTRSLGFYFWYN